MTHGTRRKRALVIGGSISGLFVGLLLLRRGWEVEIFERVEVPLAGRGAGIVTHPEFAVALAAAGIGADEALGVEVPGRRTFDRGGRLVAELRRPQTLTSWDRLHSLLRARFPAEHYHLGKELHSFERDGGVGVRFADGTAAEGDLLIGADGIRSTVRAGIFPGVSPAYAGYVAWRGLVPEADLSARVRAEVFDYFAFCLPPGEQMLGYPVAGPLDDLRVGHRSYNFVWYRPVDEQHELQELLTDESGRTHALSIPPPLLRPEAIREIRAASEQVLAPQFQEFVRLTAQPILQPIYDLESPSMTADRTALIGDAAFVARPHVGAGVAKAALDALALAEALAATDDLGTALQRFDGGRRPVGRRIVARARELGDHLRRREPSQPPAGAPAPEAVMRDIAVLDFLRG